LHYGVRESKWRFKNAFCDFQTASCFYYRYHKQQEISHTGYANGTITNCYATGSVSGGDESWYLGGLCGSNRDSVIFDSYATGNVVGATDSICLGGICGYNSDAGILNCYSTGNIQGSNYIGGVCGRHVGSSAIIADTFWDIDTSGTTIGYVLSTTTPGLVENVLGKTTAQMQDVNTYLNAGWDVIPFIGAGGL